MQSLIRSRYIATLLLASLLPQTLPALEVYVWNGKVSPRLSESGNWESGAVPAFGTTLDACLSVGLSKEELKNEMNYTAKEGATSFALGKGGASMIGHMGTAVLNVSGGTLDFNSAELQKGDPTSASLWIGNGPAPGKGTLNLSGGQVRCKSALILGRDGSVGTLNISGGTLTVGEDGLNIANIGTAAGKGMGHINLSGSGKLVILGATPASKKQESISFRPGASTAGNYINFVSGGSESLSLPASTDNFGALVSSGYVKIDGGAALGVDQFSKTADGRQNIYRLGKTVHSAAVASAGPVVEEISGRPLLLSAADGMIAGTTAKLTRSNTGSIIDAWTDTRDSVRWNAKVLSPGIFDVILEYSADEPNPGSLVEVAVGTQGVQTRLESTETLTNYSTKFLGQVQISQAGVTPVNLSVLEKRGKWVMNLRSISLRRSNQTVLQDPPMQAVHPAHP